MSMKFTTVPTKTLAQSLNSTSTKLIVDDILGWDGSALTSADFGTRLFVVLRNDDNTQIEIKEVDPSTVGSAATTGFDIIGDNLDFDGNLSNTGTGLTWVKNQTFVEIGSHVPQLLNHMVQIIGDQTIAGAKTFSTVPSTTGGDAVSDNDLVRKAQLDAATLGQIGTDKLIIAGTAGETIADGDLIYFDTVTNNEWMKADASAAASADNVLLGIAQGAGTDGGAISGGVLVLGVDDAQTGMTIGNPMYASDTAGDISSSAGTIEVVVGIAKSATELYFNPRFAQQLTENIQDALENPKSGGALSSSNVVIDENYTAEANTASKIPVRDSNGDVLVAATPTNTNAATPKNYVDLRDGVYSVPMGEAFTGATTPQAAVLINDLYQPLVDRFLDVGETSGEERYALKIIPRTTFTLEGIVAVLLYDSGASNNIRVVIEGDSAGDPDGSVITNGTSSGIATGSLSTSDGTVAEFTFSTPPTLVADTTYWIILENDTAVSANHFYVSGISSTSLDYASFDGKYYNGSAWVAGGLMSLELKPATVGSYSVWLADENHANPLMQNVHGFVTSTGSAGDDATFVRRGVVGGFSSLQQFADYYLGTTAGAVDPDNTGQFVGTGYSATQLILPEGKRTGQTYAMDTVSTTFYTTIRDIPIKFWADGFLTVVSTDDSTATTNLQIDISNDGGSADRNFFLDEGTNGERATLTIPVRKGDWVKAEAISTGTAIFYFTPLI